MVQVVQVFQHGQTFWEPRLLLHVWSLANGRLEFRRIMVYWIWRLVLVAASARFIVSKHDMDLSMKFPKPSLSMILVGETTQYTVYMFPVRS